MKILGSDDDIRNRRNERLKSWWVRQLKSLYDAARKRKGQSLTIYSDVNQLLNYLEGVDEIPEGFDLFQACDNLAAKLRQI